MAVMTMKKGTSIVNDIEPSNIEAERACIASVLRDNSLYFRHKITHEMFSDPELRRVWMAVKHLAEKGRTVDAPTILSLYSQHDQSSSQVKGTLNELSSKVINIGNYGNTFELLKQSYLMRQIYKKSKDIKDIALSGGDAVAAVSSAANLISSIKVDQRDKNCADGLDEYYQQMVYNIENGIPPDNLYPTEFKNLNEALAGGFREEDYCIIAANSSGCKSLWGFQLSYQQAELGHDTMLFSAEMGESIVRARTMSCLGQINLTDILTNSRYIHKASLEKGFRRMKDIFGKKLHIYYEPSISIEKFTAEIAMFTAVNGAPPKFVVVDYLQQMTSEKKIGGGSRNELVAYISRCLKDISRTYKCCVIAFAQLQNEAAKEDRPQRWHVAEAPNQIWRDADTLFLMHSIGPRVPGEMERIKVYVDKGRNIGCSEMEFHVMKQFMSFYETGGVQRNYMTKIEEKQDAEEIVKRMYQEGEKAEKGGGDQADVVPDFGGPDGSAMCSDRVAKAAKR